MFLRRLGILSIFVFLSTSGAAQSLSPTLDFKLADLGSVSFTAGADDTLIGGYTRIQVSSGILPGGMAILKYRQNGVLVSQAAVPAMPVMTSGRTYAGNRPAISTGIAFVNPNSQPVTITFYFTDTKGNTSGQGSTVISANSQLAAFVNEAPFNSGSSFVEGSFTFTASSSVSAIAFLRHINERNEVLLTTFQVTDLSRPPAEVQTVAHFVTFLADWHTDVVFVNPTDSVISGTVQAFSSNGQPQNVALGEYRDSYTIPPRSAARFEMILSGSFTSTPTGSVRITPVTGNAPSVTAFFINSRPAGPFRTSMTWTETSVPAIPASTSIRVFAENLGSLASTGTTQTGIAIANPNPTPVDVALELFGGDGISTGLEDTISIPANGQRALFINQIPGLSPVPSPFRGVLRLTSLSPISVTGLLATYNERSEFIIAPTFPVAETELPTSTELLWPYFLSGLGYETEFVVFSRVAPSFGTVYLYDQNGNMPSLIINPTVNPAAGGFGISTALQLDKTTVNPGQTLNATVTYKNSTSSAVTINAIVIASRPPRGTNGGGPYANLSPEAGVTTVQPGGTIQLSASRAFTAADPAGTWYAFSTYQDSSLTWHDGPNVNFTVSVSSTALAVNAGPNQTITSPSSASLNGTVSGFPTGSTATTTWSKSSGPGTVSFGNVNALSTTASFSTSGTYVLQLTASDGVLSSSSTVTIVVNSSGSTGKTYYVSNSGNDSSSGSQSSPWKTIAKVQSFLGNLRPGDSVLFQRGRIWYEELDLNNVNGTAGARITFGNYGTGNLPIIDGGGTKSGLSILNGRQWCMGGNSSKMSYITIDGFECRNASNYGIAFYDVYEGSAGITVQNSYIHDTGDGDYGYHNQLMYADYRFWTGGAGTKFLNNRVGNCYGHNCIEIHGDMGSPLIQGNECWGWSHNCIDMHNVVGAVVDQNVVHDGLGNEPAQSAFYLENCGNTNCGSTYFGSNPADVTWTRNVVYGFVSQGAFQCQDDAGPVICRAYNNTVYTNGYGMYASDWPNPSPTNVKFYAKNNILDTPRPFYSTYGGSFVEWDYNDDVQGGSVPSNHGSHEMTQVNPQYVNASGHDFHLQSGSPLIGKGTNVNLPYSGSAPDLGALE